MEIKCHLDIEHSEKFLRDVKKIIEDNVPTEIEIDEVIIMAHAMEDTHLEHVTNEYLVVDIDGSEEEISISVADYNRAYRDFLHFGPFNQRWETFVKDRVKKLLPTLLEQRYEEHGIEYF